MRAVRFATIPDIAAIRIPDGRDSDDLIGHRIGANSMSPFSIGLSGYEYCEGRAGDEGLHKLNILKWDNPKLGLPSLTR